MWNQDRHDYIALLAAAQEEIPTEASGMTAGALWERAAQVALDDAGDGVEGQAPDSAALFAYHVRASRAFVVANRGIACTRVAKSVRRFGSAPNKSVHLFRRTVSGWPGMMGI